MDNMAYRHAVDDFRRVRSKAALQEFWANFTGQDANLLQYDEISKKLHATVKAEKGLQSIKVKDIIGSVGRYHDFNKNFLPLRDNDIFRWATVKAAMTSAGGMGVPPISVYKLGESYFVLDGNHRVSIAKQMEFEEIEAYVTDITTKVPFTPEMSAADLILEEEYLNFLSDTHIDEVLSEVNFKLTFIDQYELLKEHINVHKYFMGIEENREVSWNEAVVHWYNNVYIPVVEKIRELEILREFPNRTETDLYLWVLDHQSQLQEEYGWKIRADIAASDLLKNEGKTKQASPMRGLQHIEEIVDGAITKKISISPPSLGLLDDNLFQDILVAIRHMDQDWQALEQAIIFSNLVGGAIRGIHVKGDDDNKEEQLSRIQTRFAQRLSEVSKSGNLTFASGEIRELLIEHSRLNDALVIKLNYPPGRNLFNRLKSGFLNISRKIDRPILAVGDNVTPMNKTLLAYDGSEKSKEALFIAAYLSARWKFPLHIITVADGSADLDIEVAYAKKYLSMLGIEFEYQLRAGKVAQRVIEYVHEKDINFLLIGGYRDSTYWDVVLGSDVDAILRRLEIPVLLCQ